MESNYPKIALQGIEGLTFVQENEIVSADADGNYTLVSLTHNRQVKVLRQLKEVEELLQSEKYCRIHRSHLINLEHVLRLEEETVVMNTGASLPVARDRKMDFIDKFTRI